MQNKIKRFAVMLMGPSNVGKTSLLHTLKESNERLEGTIGIDCCVCEDLEHTTKGVFYDPSGQNRFSGVRKAFLDQRKDCIVIVVDNLDYDQSLVEIEKCLSEIDDAYQENNCPPLGLIVNQKTASLENSKSFYTAIEAKYADRFVFIDHCSVLDKAYRDSLFNQFARISRVPVIHKDPEVQDWSGWISGIGKSVVGGVSGATGYMASFFQRAPVVQSVEVKSEEIASPSV